MAVEFEGSCSFCHTPRTETSQRLLRRDASIAEFLAKRGGKSIAACCCMQEPSAKRQRTLALHERALQFSNAVNLCCPERFSNVPSSSVWDQLVRAADGTSNNLIAADDASSDADFLSKMGIALREAKESRAALIKIRLGSLDHFERTAKQQLESEAGQLAAIFAAIIRNMRMRLDEQKKFDGKKRTGTRN